MPLAGGHFSGLSTLVERIVYVHMEFNNLLSLVGLCTDIRIIAEISACCSVNQADFLVSPVCI